MDYWALGGGYGGFFIDEGVLGIDGGVFVTFWLGNDMKMRKCESGKMVLGGGGKD